MLNDNTKVMKCSAVQACNKECYIEKYSIEYAYRFISQLYGSSTGTCFAPVIRVQVNTVTHWCVFFNFCSRGNSVEYGQWRIPQDVVHISASIS